MVEPPIKSRLESKDFTTDLPKPVQDRLSLCLASDPEHITPGDKGEHVKAIQKALEKIRLAAPNIKLPEIHDTPGTYGEYTIAAVLKYKSFNGIKRTGQKLDEIVGRMTLTRLDDELKNRAVPPPVPVPPGPKPVPPGAKFAWTPLRPPVVISQLNDNPNAQDLENSPVTRTATYEKALHDLEHPVTESNCNRDLLAEIGKGGREAREMAEFFFSNSKVKFERPMPAFWSKRIKSDGRFLQNHMKLSFAIKDSLNFIKFTATGVPPEVDVNKLVQGPAQPGFLRSFKNDFDFGGVERQDKGDPLAFGIGGTQGHLVSIFRFAGEPDGAYEGELSYELIDHFGSDDSDLDYFKMKVWHDKGQPSLWLLQRKLVKDKPPIHIGYEPYRHRTKLTLGFVGRLS